MAGTATPVHPTPAHLASTDPIDRDELEAVIPARIEEARKRRRPRLHLATLVLFSLVVLVAAALAGAAPPPPPPKFWTVSRCEQEVRVHDRVVTAQGYGFHVGLRVCVGTGGPQACEWASDHGSRLYSRFTVFSRSRYIGGVVRSWTLATRGGDGLVAVLAHAGDQYVGWPAEFFMSPVSVRVVASNATPARFRSIVAPIAAGLTRQQNAAGCTGG